MTLISDLTMSPAEPAQDRPQFFGQLEALRGIAALMESTAKCGAIAVGSH